MYGHVIIRAPVPELSGVGSTLRSETLELSTESKVGARHFTSIGGF